MDTTNKFDIEAQKALFKEEFARYHHKVSIDNYIQLQEALQPQRTKKVLHFIREKIAKIFSKEVREPLDTKSIEIIEKLFGKEYIKDNFKELSKKDMKIKDLHKEIKTMDWNCQFSGQTIDTLMRRDNFQKTVKEKLSGEILIDLFGNGQTGLGKLDTMNTKHTIHVDIRIPHNLPNTENKSYIESDALRFISLLPDNSVNYWINAIDSAVLSSNRPLYPQSIKDYEKPDKIYKEYLSQLIKEVQRTVKKGGILFGTFNDRKNEMGEGFTNRINDCFDDPEIIARALSHVYIYEKQK